MISGPPQWAPPRTPAGEPCEAMRSRNVQKNCPLHQASFFRHRYRTYLLPGSWRGLFTNVRAFFRALSEASPEQPKVRRFLASYQHSFSMNTSWRGEEVTQDKASGTKRPTFKVAPLDPGCKCQLLFKPISTRRLSASSRKYSKRNAELPPLWWSSESLEYTLPEGEPGSCKKSRRRTCRSLSARRSGLRRPAESPLPKSPVNWALATAQSISGAKNWRNMGLKRFQVVDTRRHWRKKIAVSNGNWRERARNAIY